METLIFLSLPRVSELQASRSKKADNLAEVLERAFALNKVVVIECPIDYSVNYETFSIELKEISCNIMEKNLEKIEN